MEENTASVTTIATSSEMQIAVVAFILSMLTFKLVRKLTSEENPPPGPWGFPILGYLPLLGKEPNVTFMKLREKFGDIFQIQMGSWTVVVVNGKQAIREALKNSRDDFSGRPQFVSTKILHNGENLTFGVYDDKWRIHHKLANKVLFEFSNAKRNPIQDMVEEEIDIVISSFVTHEEKSFNPRNLIRLSVASIIYQICYGRKQNIRDSNDFVTFLNASDKFSNFVNAGNHFDMLPWPQYIVPSRIKKLAYLIDVSIVFRQKRVDEHRVNISQDHIHDLTDGLLAVSKQETRLTEERILSTIDSVFGAGFDTLTQTLCWAVLLMAAHPHIQKRVQDELDDVIGVGRRPGLQDRAKLVYTEAVLHELNRYAAVVTLSLPHATIRDTHLGSYSINKDTVVFINLFSMSHDKSVWGDPEVFRPERFLDESGQIKKSLLEEFLPFSTGNRKCIGELLARTEIFLFFTGLLQRCSIIKPPEVREYNMNSMFKLTRECLPYKIQVHMRN